MTLACRRSLVHGPLLLLRYTLGGLPWVKLTISRDDAGTEGHGLSPSNVFREWIDRLMGLLEQVGE